MHKTLTITFFLSTSLFGQTTHDWASLGHTPAISAGMDIEAQKQLTTNAIEATLQEPMAIL
jgi:hypothetical protein